jgi:hypothetical protein
MSEEELTRYQGISIMYVMGALESHYTKEEIPDLLKQLAGSYSSLVDDYRALKASLPK